MCSAALLHPELIIMKNNDLIIHVKGEEHVYHEPWGEQMSGKVHPVLCVLDIEAGAVSVLENIPDDISPGQVGHVAQVVF